MMSSKTFTTTIYRDGSTCFIPVPFDPKPVFGCVRAVADRPAPRLRSGPAKTRG